MRTAAIFTNTALALCDAYHPFPTKRVHTKSPIAETDKYSKCETRDRSPVHQHLITGVDRTQREGIETALSINLGKV